MRESAAHFHHYRASYVFGLLDRRVESKYPYFLGTRTCDGESREADVLVMLSRKLATCQKPNVLDK